MSPESGRETEETLLPVDEEFADKMYEEQPEPAREFDKKHDVSVTGSDLTKESDCD